MSDEQTKALRRSRGDVKRNLTRIIKFVDTHNKPGDEIAVQQRIHELEPLLDKFNDIQNQIETLIDFDNDDAVEKEDSEREEFESKYYETLAMATNFRLYNFIRSKSNFDVIQTSLANDSISWIFIPANSPNWGGLWEAGVKSVKFHLKRVLGNANLVFEDLCSVLCQIESILNSRPLSPLSNDPNDMTPLTPGHFLIGRPLTTIPSDNHLDTPMKRLNRFEYQEKICQDFWQRWHQEYLSYLQQRKKWTQSTRQIRPGDLVVIRDQNLPPMRWKMGRVEEVYPSPSDGVVRVASVRCAGKIVKRACNRLCVLPLDDE
ncbi:hypothetical protein TcasGA2_TC002454 [Tribolium castaneum]|uniref:DUF5641 domain-containing protein n=1 Tax=Tribolium castaneum TaxID=7070 RepID=D6WI41_TRICA|nr:hypothetical protein TcasGA2_TC002454 [Tribolium castaneum]